MTAMQARAISPRGGFDPPRRVVAPPHPGLELRHGRRPEPVQSPFRAGIKTDAYQMEPLRKALRLLW
jgi:hypothetical protein